MGLLKSASLVCANAITVLLVIAAPAICKSCGGGVPCGDGDCCQANDSAGCTDPLCCALVCQELPACCDVEWDATCASIALSACPGCSGGG
jgi:hypothetical protein